MSFYYYYYLARPTGLEPVTHGLEGLLYPTELRAYLFMVRPLGFEPRTAEL